MHHSLKQIFTYHHPAINLRLLPSHNVSERYVVALARADPNIVLLASYPPPAYYSTTTPCVPTINLCNCVTQTTNVDLVALFSRVFYSLYLSILAKYVRELKPLSAHTHQGM